MFFKGRIEKHASEQCAKLFVQHKLNDTVLQVPEAIATLAEEQTTLYLQQHPKLQSQQEAADIYRAEFIRGYTQGVREQGTGSFKEDVMRLLHMPPDDQTQEPA